MRKNSFGRKLHPASTSCNIISKCIFLSPFTTWISMTHSQLARSSIKNSSCGNCFLSVSTKRRALRRCSTEGKSRSPKWPSKHRVLLTWFTCRTTVKVDSNFGVHKINNGWCPKMMYSFWELMEFWRFRIWEKCHLPTHSIRIKLTETTKLTNCRRVFLAVS